MSKRESISRYNIIIKRLRKSPASFNEISDALEKESDMHGYNFAVSKRTFQRDLEDICSLFDMEIKYDFSRKVYFINEDEEQTHQSTRMLEAFDTVNVLNVANGLSPYIHFENRRPQGTHHFYGLLHAIKNNNAILLSYRKFWDDETSERKVRPYALKEFKNRWYLIAEDSRDNIVKSFCLDRITDFETIRESFKRISAAAINNLFSHCFGIINTTDTEPEKIELSFSPLQGNYIRTYPLHESQQVITDNSKEFRVQLHLRITHDLIMELLSFGSELKVISPLSLREELCNIFSDAIARNSETVTRK